MNSIPWSPVLRYTTPVLMNRTPVSTVALQHKSVSSVLRYATPLPINRPPISTVGGMFLSLTRSYATSIQHVTHHITLRPHARYSHGCHLTWPGTVCAFWLTYMIVSLASISQRTRADMASREPKAALTHGDRHT